MIARAQQTPAADAPPVADVIRVTCTVEHWHLALLKGQVETARAAWREVAKGLTAIDAIPPSDSAAVRAWAEQQGEALERFDVAQKMCGHSLDQLLVAIGVLEPEPRV